MAYAELHCLSSFSFQRGASQPRELVERAAIGPVPGEFMLICGLLYNAAWIGTALVTLRIDQASHRNAQSEAAMG